MSFFKVIVLEITLLETFIADEKHFATREQARAYAKQSESRNKIAVIVQM